MTRNLRKLREQVGWTQFQLTAATGIERSRLSLIENQHVIATTNERKAIETALLAEIAVRAQQFNSVLKNAESEERAPTLPCR